jgi:hypothetical protein
MSDKKIADILDAVEAREILKVLKLFRQIRIELPQPRKRLSTVWFDSNARVMVDGEVERQPRVFVSTVRTLRLAQEIPVLALDGTGSIDLNRRIFGERMTCERFAVPRNAEVWQVTSKAFSRQSITGTDRRGNPISPKKTSEAARLRRQVLDLLKMLPGKVLLVTYKQAEEILGPICRRMSTRSTSAPCAGSTLMSTARPPSSSGASSHLHRRSRRSPALFAQPMPSRSCPWANTSCSPAGDACATAARTSPKSRCIPIPDARPCSSRCVKQRSRRRSTGCGRCLTGAGSSC